MTRQELDDAFLKLSLPVPENERDDIYKAIEFLEAMFALNSKFVTSESEIP